MKDNFVVLYLCLQKRHSVDQCSGEQSRARSDRATPPRVRTSPRGLSLSKLNLKGASETTVKILLQRKHQRGETWSKQKDPVQVFDFMEMFLTHLRSFPYVAHMFSISLSVFIQWQDVLSWRHVAPSFGEGPGMHPVHLYRWPPGLQTHHVPQPVPMPASSEISGKVLQDLSR